MNDEQYFETDDMEKHKKFLSYLHEKYLEYIKIISAKHLAKQIMDAYRSEKEQDSVERILTQHRESANEILVYLDCIDTLVSCSVLSRVLLLMYEKYMFLNRVMENDLISISDLYSSEKK